MSQLPIPDEGLVYPTTSFRVPIFDPIFKKICAPFACNFQILMIFFRVDPLCLLCRGVLDEAHVAFVCPAMDVFRYGNSDVMVFMTMCRARGVLPQLAYKMYVRGPDWNGGMVPTPLYLECGKILQRVVDEWLRRT